VQALLAHADPQRMAPHMEGYRYQVLTPSYDGVAQRWVLIYSKHRRSQAQYSVHKQLRKQSEKEAEAFKKLCHATFACEADAQQALATFEGVQAIALHAFTIRAKPRYDKQGRPGPDIPPAQVVYQLEGMVASSFYLKKPERIMAWLTVITACLLVYSVLDYHIRTALKEKEATFPNHKGQPIQNSTARWVFQYFVGIHLPLIPGEWPLILNFTEEHQKLLQLLGQSYERFSS
jgi:hypothetical protein